MNRQKFVNALELVKPGISNHTSIPQAHCFAFIKGHVVTYNDELSIQHPIEVPLSGVVQAEEFYSLISKMTQEEITIADMEKELLIRAGRTRAGITKQNEVTMPLEQIEQMKTWGQLPDNFVDAASFCLVSCARDLSMPLLVCVHFTESVVESCDNQRVSRYFFNKKAPITKSLLIPYTSVYRIVKYPITQISVGENWAHFRTEKGTILSCRIAAQDQYPDLNKFIDSPNSTGPFALPKGLMEMLERARVFSVNALDVDRTIDVRIEKETLHISTKNDVGWVKEKVPIKYTGPSIQFRILLSVFEGILSKTNQFYLTEAGLIKFEGDQWVHCALLLVDSTEE